MEPATEDNAEDEPWSKRQKNSMNEVQNPPREIGLMRSTPGEKLASFVGSSSGIYFIRSVYSAIKAQSSAAEANNINASGSELVPGEDDQLPATTSSANKKYLWQADEVSGPQPAHLAVTFSDLIQWSQSYFDNWHSAYPFLHAPSVIEHFESLEQHGFPAEAVSSFEMIILRSIMSISLADHRQTGKGMHKPIPADLVFDSFSSASGSVGKVLTEPTSIMSLQATISVQLFLVSMLRYNGASRLEGLVVRMAYQLGLHRCPVRYSTFSHEECQMRKRVFWSLYALDRYICHALGLPLGLQDDDLDVCLPSKERHSKKPQPQPDDRLYLLEILAKHAEMRGMIIELRNKSIAYRQKNQDQAVVITAKSSKWWNEVEEFLENDVTHASTLAETHRTVLMVLKHENMIALNRPILAVSKKSSSYNAALQDCIGASRSIINILWRALQSHSGGKRQPLLWHSYTWAVWMSAYIVYYATNEGEIRKDIAIKLTDRCLEILEHLAIRGSIWPEACAAAIRDLRKQMEKRQPLSQAQEGPITTSQVSNVAIQDTTFGIPQQQTSPPIETGTQYGMSTNGQLDAGHRPRSGLSGGGLQQLGMGTTTENRNPTDSAYETYRQTASPQSQRSPPSHANNHGSSFAAGYQGLTISGLQSVGHTWSGDDPAFSTPGFDNSNPASADPFYGFDIPFWMGQDQYSVLSNEWI